MTEPPTTDPRALLPHRAPIALIHQIVEQSPDRILARTAPFSRHRDLAGYFRSGTGGRWPATLIIEAWCQAAGILLLRDRCTAPAAVLISSLREVEQHGRAAAGALTLRAIRTRRYDEADQFTGTVTSGGVEIVTIGSLTAAARSFPIAGVA